MMREILASMIIAFIFLFIWSYRGWRAEWSAECNNWLHSCIQTNETEFNCLFSSKYDRPGACIPVRNDYWKKPIDSTN